MLQVARGGYGNAYPASSVASIDIWTFAKYPPDLPFLAWSFACIFLTLAALSTITRGRVPMLLRPFVVFGRVPFFFYVVHFYVLGIAQAVLRTKVDLPETYLIWSLLMLAMAWPCEPGHARGTTRRSATGRTSSPGISEGSRRCLKLAAKLRAPPRLHAQDPRDAEKVKMDRSSYKCLGARR